MRGAALAVRLLCELAMLAALGYWGVRTGGNVAFTVVLAVGAPLLAAVVWGTFLSPKRRVELGERWRIALELLVFGGAVWALAAAGQPVLAAILAALVVAQRVVLSASGGSDPTHLPGPLRTDPPPDPTAGAR